MKVFTLALFVAVVASVYAADKYTTKYDNINLDEILNSDRLLTNYFNCIMERGNCTPDGQELKNTIPEALKTDCAKCSDKQKEGSKKVLRFLVKNKRPMFDELIAKYDPEGVYRAKYKDEYEKEGITL